MVESMEDLIQIYQNVLRNQDELFSQLNVRIEQMQLLKLDTKFLRETYDSEYSKAMKLELKDLNRAKINEIERI